MSDTQSPWLFLSSRAAVDAVGQRTRRRRMEVFARTLGVRPGMRILDLGGRPKI